MGIYKCGGGYPALTIGAVFCSMADDEGVRIDTAETQKLLYLAQGRSVHAGTRLIFDDCYRLQEQPGYREISRPIGDGVKIACDTSEIGKYYLAVCREIWDKYRQADISNGEWMAAGCGEYIHHSTIR